MAEFGHLRSWPEYSGYFALKGDRAGYDTNKYAGHVDIYLMFVECNYIIKEATWTSSPNKDYVSLWNFQITLSFLIAVPCLSSDNIFLKILSVSLCAYVGIKHRPLSWPRAYPFIPPADDISTNQGAAT